MSLLAAQDLTVRFGARRVLDAVSMTLVRGEIVGLIGPNGAGKTTLLRACAGLIAEAAGRIRIDGTAIASLERQRRARTIAYLPQEATCHWPLEVGRLVALGRLPHLLPWQRPSGDDAAAVATALRLADVEDLVGRNVPTLSGGELGRVLLARALAVEPALLLADEPVAGLDPEHQLRMMAVLRDRSRAGAGVVVTLHDLGLAARFCDRLVLLSAGRIAADGAPDAVLTAERLACVYGITARIDRADGQMFVTPSGLIDDGAEPPRRTGAAA